MVYTRAFELVEKEEEVRCADGRRDDPDGQRHRQEVLGSDVGEEQEGGAEQGR